MANYRAVANGNWSAGATWGGGSVPPNGEGHNIYSNNFTVTIDQDVNVALLTNASITASFVGAGTSAAAGGGFSVSSSGLSVLANITGVVSATNAITFSGLTPSTLTLTGNITANAASGGATTGHAVGNTGTGIITINTGTLTPGSFNSQSRAVNNSSTGQIVLNTCTINGGTRLQEAAVYNLSGVITANNCAMTGFSVYSSGSLVATGCVFNANTTSEAVQATGNVRLSGTFVAASNGRQPINATAWILNSSPTASYIQHALDGINANSFVRFFTADNGLGQANPTDVRSGVTYASGNLTGRLTVPARGSVALSVNYGPSMPFTATRNGTTATATLTYSYPLVVGDQITVTGASNAEWNGSYTIASVVSGTSVTFTVPNTISATAGTGANMQTTGTAVLDPAAVASAVWGAASRTITGGLVDTATTLTNAPASVTPSDIWSHATRTLTSASGPTAVQIRQEIDANSTKLDAAISSRLAAADYNAPTSAPTAASVANAVWSAAARTITGGTVDTLTNAPTVPSAAAIATQVWAVADKTGYSLTSAERSAIATAVESSILNEADGQAVLNAIVGAIGNTNLSEVSLVAAVRADLERAGGKLDSIPTTSAPSASTVAGAVRTELGTELSRIDQSISSRLAASSYTAPANSDIAAIKAKTDNLPASPAATGDIPSANITAIKAKTDQLNTDRLANVATTNIVGTLLAQANS